jgi:hypothetical protein
VRILVALPIHLNSRRPFPHSSRTLPALFPHSSRGSPLSSKVQKAFREECKTMARLRHPNVVLFMGFAETEEDFVLVLELCEQGSFHDLYVLILNHAWTRETDEGGVAMGFISLSYVSPVSPLAGVWFVCVSVTVTYHKCVSHDRLCLFVSPSFSGTRMTTVNLPLPSISPWPSASPPTSRKAWRTSTGERWEERSIRP